MNDRLTGILILFLFISPLLLADNAMILENKGSVLVQSSGKSSQAETGMNLKPGDIVTTGENGSVLILLSDGTRIDLFPNSRLLVSDSENRSYDEDSFLGRLWQSIKGKFSDVEYTSAQTGRVGALRASVEDEEIFNDFLTDARREELSELVRAIRDEKLPDNTARQMEAIVLEEHGQFIDAEEIYLSLLETYPDDLILYDMLIDLYLKIDFYGHAQEIIQLKKEREALNL